MKDINQNDIENNFPLAARTDKKEKSIVRVGDAEIGGKSVNVIAGPCTVENEEMTIEIAKSVKQSGATVLRGGAYKPITFPYRSEKMFELGEKGLKILQKAGKESGLPVVSEVVDIRLVQMAANYLDMIQIGARNMQNFPMLEEVAKTKKPVLLKRHPGSSLRDWLGAAEYILYNGNPNVILCERGIVAPHTHQVTSRFIVDLQVVPAVREFSHLPILVDPSHSTFRRPYVQPVACAAIAIGADGILIDVHPTPEKAAVDPLQAQTYEAFEKLMVKLERVASAVDRTTKQGELV